MPYNFGATLQLLNEIFRFDDFPTSSVRNIYSPDTVTARELMVDQTAKLMNQDPVEFRRAFLKADARLLASARQGRQGRQVGPQDARRHRAGHRDPQRVQEPRSRAWSRSTAGRRP